MKYPANNAVVHQLPLDRERDVHHLLEVGAPQPLARAGRLVGFEAVLLEVAKHTWLSTS
jgi:hypothetical protein